jgi:hypothetical protein
MYVSRHDASVHFIETFNPKDGDQLSDHHHENGSQVHRIASMNIRKLSHRQSLERPTLINTKKKKGRQDHHLASINIRKQAHRQSLIIIMETRPPLININEKKHNRKLWVPRTRSKPELWSKVPRIHKYRVGSSAMNGITTTNISVIIIRIDFSYLSTLSERRGNDLKHIWTQCRSLTSVWTTPSPQQNRFGVHQTTTYTSNQVPDIPYRLLL